MNSNTENEITFNDLPQYVLEVFKRVERIESILNEIGNKNSDTSSVIMTRKDIKNEFQVSYGTIHKLMRDDILSFKKIGRKTLFQRADVIKCFMN